MLPPSRSRRRADENHVASSSVRHRYHDLATHDIDFALALARDAFGGGDAVAHAPDEVYAVGSSSTPALAAAGVHDVP